jgi:hypothetical protein
MYKNFIFFLFLVVNLFSNETMVGVDCIILEDEGSIVCKYMHKRVPYDKNITIYWVDPTNHISRQREMKIPAYHGSVYDYRYIKGRIKGRWSFRVLDANKTYSTTFELK